MYMMVVKIKRQGVSTAHVHGSLTYLHIILSACGHDWPPALRKHLNAFVSYEGFSSEVKFFLTSP